MKKLFAVLLAIAMAAIGTVSALADDAGGSGASTELTAAYASAEPTIDGEIDKIWSTTSAITFRYGTADAECYVKLLWSEEYIYILAVLPGEKSVRIAMTEQKHTGDGVSYWGNGYGFVAKTDGTITNGEWYVPAVADLNAKAVAYGTGLILEAAVKRQYLSENYTNGTVIGFAAKTLTTNDTSKGAEWDFPNAGTNAGKLAAVTLVGDPCTHEGEWEAATCDHARRCKTCGAADPDSAPDPNNHSGEQVATVSEDGTTHTVAWSCCHVTVVENEAHTYPEDYVVDREPTCTEAGSKSKSCTVCGKSNAEEAIPALGHDEGTWVTISAATCRKDGTEKRECGRCGGSLEIRTVPKTEHTGGEWIVDREAAVGVVGKRHKVCTFCGATCNEEEIPALPEESGTDGEDDAAVAKKGCGAQVSASAIVGMAPMAFAVPLLQRKKKKD